MIDSLHLFPSNFFLSPLLERESSSVVWGRSGGREGWGIEKERHILA